MVTLTFIKFMDSVNDIKRISDVKKLSVPPNGSKRNLQYKYMLRFTCYVVIHVIPNYVFSLLLMRYDNPVHELKTF